MNPRAVASLLEMDAPSQNDERRSFIAAIRTAMTYGGHGRTLGEASPRHAETAARAQAAADQLPVGFAGALLFGELAAAARKKIDRDRREDEEEMQGWH